MTALFRCVLLACAALFGGFTAHAQDFKRLGSYERDAVKSAMTERELVLDPTPSGKIIDRIHVVSLPVFDPSAGFLQAFNRFHRNSQPDVLERELIIRRGERWNRERVLEAERGLRNILINSVVVILPVKSDKPGHTDLLLINRDIWSLRTNSEFENQSGTFTKLQLALAENNFLGWRKLVSVVFNMDLGKYSIGPRYIDTNLLGTRAILTVRPRVLFSRTGSELEGTQSQLKLEMPLWSLRRRWGWVSEFTHQDSVVRVHRGTELARYDNPDTTDVVEEVPHTYRLLTAKFIAEATRSVGTDVRQHFTFGQELALSRPELRTDFIIDDTTAAAFIRDVFPRDERTFALVARYRLFTPRFRKFRNINSYDLPETVPLGPNITFELAYASRRFASTKTFLRYRSEFEYTTPIGNGYLFARTGFSGRFGGSQIEDRRIDLQLFAASPVLLRSFRVIGHTSASFVNEVVDNELFIVGGQTGLRGFEVGAFTGHSFALANVELRMLPHKLWFMRVGALAFLDVGHAAGALDELALRSNFGVGIRVLAPQTGESIYRLDWAVANTPDGPDFPGRIGFGIEQAF